MKKLDYLIEDLSKFGLSNEEAIVYIELLKGGRSSAYQLSKKLQLGRSKVSSIIRSLEDKNMVFEQVKGSSTEYQAHPYRNLAALVEIEEAEIKNRKSSLPDLYDKFSEIVPSTKLPKSKVYHYYGIDGLKQVTWNSLKAKGVMKIFEVSRLSVFLQQDFADDYRMECVRRGITHMDLTNEAHMPGWTDVQEFVDSQKLRYIDPKILKIKFEILIYNDIVALLDYKDKEIFCVEIHSASLAELQNQLFDYVWKDAVEMKFIGPRGEAKVVD